MNVGLNRKDWGIILLLATVQFTHMLDFVIVMPLGKMLIMDLKINPTLFGYLVSAYGLAAFVAGLIAALIVDRFDRRAVMLFAYAGFSLSTLYCGIADDFAHLILARAMAGAFGGVAASAIMAIIGDVIVEHRRGTAIGAVSSSFAVASIIGLPIGLYLAEEFGRKMPFLALGVLSFFIWGMIWLRLPSINSHRVTNRRNPLVEFAILAKHPNHLRSFIFMFCMVLGTFTIIPFIAPYMQYNCGLSIGDVRIVYSIAGLVTLIGMNVVGRLSDSLGRHPVFLVMAVGTILMTLLITQLPVVNVWVATLAASGFMLLAAGRVVPAQAMMLSAAIPSMRGRFTSLNNAVSHLGTGIAPIISGWIIIQADEASPLQHYDDAGYVAMSFAVVALGLSFLLRPHQVEVKAPVPVTKLQPILAE